MLVVHVDRCCASTLFGTVFTGLTARHASRLVSQAFFEQRFKGNSKQALSTPWDHATNIHFWNPHITIDVVRSLSFLFVVRRTIWLSVDAAREPNVLLGHQRGIVHRRRGEKSKNNSIEFSNSCVLRVIQKVYLHPSAIGTLT